MIQRILIPCIIVDIDGDGFEIRHFGREGVEEGVVLSVGRKSNISIYITESFRTVYTVCTSKRGTEGGRRSGMDGWRTVLVRKHPPSCRVGSVLRYLCSALCFKRMVI